jgi:Holliday junction resolvasome RuvABC DNA-binding subunit
LNGIRQQKNNNSLESAAISTIGFEKSSASGINKEIEESLQTTEKNLLERSQRAKGGLGHYQPGRENQRWEDDDTQIRDVARLLSFGYKEVNFKEIVQTLDYEN